MERSGTVNFGDIWGGEFRIPAIIGEGSGKGFNFSNLHLPRNWEEAVPKLKVNPDKLQELLDWYCQKFHLPTGEINFYPENQVLRRISIRTKPISRLELDTDFPGNSEGMYQGRNVRDLNTAIVLQRLAVGWLGFLWDEINPDLWRWRYYSHIDGEPGRGFCSHNLTIPKEYLTADEPVTHSHFQWNFRLQASNIAGRFGLTLGRIDFDERGILTSFSIKEGNACSYDLGISIDRGQYLGHNVDRADQAAVLHGIGASFINHLLKSIPNNFVD